MLVTSSSQEIRKYSMFAAIFYWDYPPLHQSSAELVLCGLLSCIFEKLPSQSKSYPPQACGLVLYTALVKVFWMITGVYCAWHLLAT